MSVKAGNLNEEALAEFGSNAVPDCSVFEHINFNTGEDDEDGWSYRTSLRILYIGDDWNDEISSMIVHVGTWRFWEHANMQGAHFDLAPGYHNVPEGWNDRISSYEPISW